MTDETLEAARKIIIAAQDCNHPCERPGSWCCCREAARQIIGLAQRQERDACAKVAATLSISSIVSARTRDGFDYAKRAIAKAILARSVSSPDEEPR